MGLFWENGNPIFNSSVPVFLFKIANRKYKALFLLKEVLLIMIMPKTQLVSGGGNFYCFSCILGLLIVSTAGCGGKEAPEILNQIVPVTVHVTFKGKPLEGATVTFAPSDVSTKTAPASAITGNDGSCQPVSAIGGIDIENSKGIAKGNYKVTINKLLMPDGKVVSSETTDAEAMEKGAKESIPRAYSDFDATKLKATITASTSELTFDLK
jgi:hypothetical protein